MTAAGRNKHDCFLVLKKNKIFVFLNTEADFCKEFSRITLVTFGMLSSHNFSSHNFLDKNVS